jgi:hypothetical protein
VVQVRHRLQAPGVLRPRQGAADVTGTASRHGEVPFPKREVFVADVSRRVTIDRATSGTNAKGWMKADETRWLGASTRQSLAGVAPETSLRERLRIGRFAKAPLP